MYQVMNDIFDIPNILELYEILQVIRSDQQNYFDGYSYEYHIQKIDLLMNYFYIDEALSYISQLQFHNKKEYIQSFQAYYFLKLLEINSIYSDNFKLKNSNIKSKIESLFMEIMSSQQLQKYQENTFNSFKILFYSIRILTNLELIDHKFISYYRSLEGANEKHQKQTYDSDVIQPESQIFNLNYNQFAIYIGITNILINYLKQGKYDDFIEENYFYQIQIINSIKCNSQFINQLLKSMSILIDNTQSLINFSELFQVTQQCFVDSTSPQRLAFSYSNIHRGFKILNLIYDQTIFKYFNEISEFEILDKQHMNQTKAELERQFKPQVKIVFHGIEELNLDNPAATQLNLEIFIQFGENEYFRLNENTDFILFWNYDRLKQFNLVQNIVIPQIIELLNLILLYFPKDSESYCEYLYSKIQATNLSVSKQQLTRWYEYEKPELINSLQSLIGFVECLEFNLMKATNTLNKDLIYYQKNGKPHQFQQEKLQQAISQAKLKIDPDIIHKIIIQSGQNLKNQIEITISQLNGKVAKINHILQKIKKISHSFK